MMLDDIGGYVASNTALTLGTDLFLSLLPDEPGNVVGLFENSGVQPISTMGSVNLPRIDRPELQFIVRNTSYAAGRTLADTLWQLITSISNATINGTLYHRIEAVTSPYIIERDANQRSVLSCNFNVLKEL